MRIGIMQGRLVPPIDDRIQCFPRDDWEAEFSLAAEAGLECIEWIYDAFGADVNPLGSDEGMQRIEALRAECGVAVMSLCADYFMDRPLVRADGAELQRRLGHLLWLMERGRYLGLQRMVLPFVDASNIADEADICAVTSVLEAALEAAEETGLELHLETSLAPGRFADLLSRLPHPLLRVNYDSGNSASLGYDVREEFAAYGDRIGSVHIKDRVRGGGTVPLGTGDADFTALFDCLGRIGYAGDYILQAARGPSGGEVVWAAQNRTFVCDHLAREGK